MTNAEAIEVLGAAIPCPGYCNWVEIRTSSKEHDALRLAIAALREKAERERRYVVVGLPGVDKPFIVKDNQMEDGRSNWVATDIPTREAAQAIADVYEETAQ